jgi:hypothetical protein
MTALMERQEATHALSSMDQETISKLVLGGDLSKLTPEQKVAYFTYRCKALNLDPATKPFDLLKLNGKEVLYATRECSNQISQRDGLSALVVKEETVNDIYKVTARVTGSDGRSTDDVGCVTIKGLSGDQLCNAIMKATTKAKRRAILSHAGLGMMDESELETVHQEPRHVPATVKPAQEPLVVIERPATVPASEFLQGAQEAHDKAKANGYQPEAPADMTTQEAQQLQAQVIATPKSDKKIPDDAQVMLVEVLGFNPNPRPVGDKGSMSYSIKCKDLENGTGEFWTSTFHKDAWEAGKLLKGKQAWLTYRYKGKYINFFDIRVS